MTLFDTIRNRQSIRAFQVRPVESEKIEAILTACNQAPSAGNCQAYQIILVRDAAVKLELAKAALGQEFMARAPVVLVFCTAADRSAKYGQRGRELYCIQDAAVAATYAQLASTAQGLATCWVGAFDEKRVSSILLLSADLRPVSMLPIGYPTETPPRTSRRLLVELVRECRPAM